MKRSDSEIVEALKTRNNSVIKEVFANNFPIIFKLVNTNTGNKDDALDLLQDALVIVFEKIQNNTFSLHDNCSFSTYLYSICRNIWWQKLENRKNKKTVELKDTNEYTEPDFGEKEYTQALKDKLFQEHFAKLKEDCKKILTLSFQPFSSDEIANQLGVTEGYLRKRKSLCKDWLITNIKQDKRYSEIY